MTNTVQGVEEFPSASSSLRAGVPNYIKHLKGYRKIGPQKKLKREERLAAETVADRDSVLESGYFLCSHSCNHFVADSLKQSFFTVRV